MSSYLQSLAGQLQTFSSDKRGLVRTCCGSLALTLIVNLVGCTEMNLMAPVAENLAMPDSWNVMKSSEEEDSFKDDFNLEGPDVIEPPFLGEYVVVSGLNLVTLEGVGLVTGLDGTGGDPPPSQYRTKLLKDMRRRDVEDPNRIISSPSTAMVIVRGYLPPLVEPGEKFDIEIRLPPGSETTSLNGGWLLECSLTERAIVAGKGVLEGKERARAKGPILVSMGERDSNSLLRRGRIVGGGIALETRDMLLFMKNDLRSVRNTTRVAKRIGHRFFSYDSYGHREPLAEPKTDQKIVLKIHPSYKDNFPRYIRVIQNIAFRESEVERQVRMERLEKELLIPNKSERAALQLEAIGTVAIPSLKKGLEADSLECRFYSSVALAYLGDSSGLKNLYLAARDEPAFRVFALAAMSVVEGGEAFTYLRQLMDEPVMETRYGAFRGLTTIDENEPLVRGNVINDQCKLHVIPVEHDPMIHLTHRQKAEIVLFGNQQDLEFKTPLALSAGPHIMINGTTGSDEIVVSRYRVGEQDQRTVVSRSIAEVIRAAGKMGASYPDLAQMLVQAERQENLPGPIGIDELPLAGRYYIRKPTDGSSSKSGGQKERIGRANMTPNNFTKDVEDDEQATKPILSPELLNMEDEDKEAEIHEPQNGGKQRGFNPLKRLKSMMSEKSSGKFVYPEEVEE